MLLFVSLAALAVGPGEVPEPVTEDAPAVESAPNTSRGAITVVTFITSRRARGHQTPVGPPCTTNPCQLRPGSTTYLSGDAWADVQRDFWIVPQVDAASTTLPERRARQTRGGTGWTSVPGAYRWTGPVAMTAGTHPGRIGGVAPAVRIDGVELLSNEMRTGRF